MKRLLSLLPLLACLALGSLALTTSASGEKKVLIVSSNAAVLRFRQVEEAFAASYGGNVSRLDLANEPDSDARVRTALLAEKPDAVFCIGSRATLATAQATQRAPIVFASTINWRRFESGENVFGVASELPLDYQLTTFRHFFPGLRRLGLLYSERFNEETARAARGAGADVRMEVIARSVHRPGDVESAARELLRGVDALWIVPDPVVLASEAAITRLLELAREARVPVLSYEESFVEHGALLAMSSDQQTIGTQAALIVEDVMAGRRLSQRVIGPAGSQIVLNARLLEHYGLRLSNEALSAVNRFVQ